MDRATADRTRPSARDAPQIGCAGREDHQPARPAATRRGRMSPAQRRRRHVRRRAPRVYRAVIEGSDSVLTFEPHPVSVVAPQHTPKLLTTLESQGRADRRAGRAGTDRDPIRRPVRGALRRAVHLRGARRGARRRPGGDRRELPLRASSAGRPPPAGRRRALSDRRAPAAGGGRRDRLLKPHPRSGARGRGRSGDPFPRCSLSAARRGDPRRRARARAGLSDRQPRAR